MTTPDKTEIAKKFGLPEAPVVTEPETAIINSGPAIFANKIYATMMPQGLRLTFAEVNPASPTPSFRAALLLGIQDAAALADLLQRQLSQIEVVETPLPVGDSGKAT